jgi:hypothetical protein
MRLALGLAVAMVAAMLLNAGFFVQHVASNTLPELSLRRPFRSLWLLFGNIRWLAGWAAGWAGWGLYIVSLRLAPLSLVQSISAGGLGVIAFMAWRRGAVTLNRVERIGALVCLGGIALVLSSLAGSVHSRGAPGWQPVVVWIGVCVVGGGVLVAGPVSRRLAGGSGLGAAGGLLYAAGDIATKGAVSSVGLFLVPTLLVCLVLGFVAQQLAFQRGSPLATAGLSTLLMNMVPIAAGVFLFREGIPLNVFGALRLAGFVAVVAGAVLLARRSAEVESAG